MNICGQVNTDDPMPAHPEAPLCIVLYCPTMLIPLLIEAYSGPAVQAARDLFGEYSESLGFDLTFQNFTNELASLPGEYATPEGCLILAMIDGEPAGCVGLRSFGGDICEMKRLYVRPTSRGLHIGELLVEAVINKAKEIGYATMRLDTVPSMETAVRLYRKFGFVEIRPYRFNPIPGAIFMECPLINTTRI